MARAGDILLRRALGEELTHAAMLASELLRMEQLTAAGLAAESSIFGLRPGLYAKVIEGGPLPHQVKDGFARRITDASGRLPWDTLLVRPRAGMGDSAAQVALGTEALPGIEAVVGLQEKPARDLSQEEARDLVRTYMASGVLQIKPPAAPDADYPRAGQKVRIALEMNGLKLIPNNPKAQGWRYTGPLDLRMVVLLCRLVQHLKEGWGTTELYWGGLGVGRDPDDRHGKGFAMDFHRIVTSEGTFDVLQDWGKQKVLLADGTTISQWPPTTQATHFRLDSESKAGRFFKDLYTFLAGQACDHAAGPTRIGASSYICHPDHPSPRLRKTHADHVHFEVGR